MTSLGLIIPQRGALFGLGELTDLLRLAPVAEQSGYFDAVWVGDSLTSKARAEAITCLAAIAGMTSSLRLGVGCLASFPLRDPALFAYQWASLDQLSGGRTLLAVCNGLQKRGGASQSEGAHFGGVPDADRVGRLEEFLDLVRQLWTGEPVTFHGRFADYEDITIQPRPVQQPCPVWISANPPLGPAAERVMRRVATRADGLLTTRVRPGYVRELRQLLDPLLREAGRDPATFPVAAYHSINVGPDAEKCLEESRRFYDEYYGPAMFDRDGARSVTALGSPDQCAEHLHELLAEGVTHLSVRMTSWSQREQLDTVIERVLPQLSPTTTRWEPATG